MSKQETRRKHVKYAKKNRRLQRQHWANGGIGKSHWVWTPRRGIHARGK